MTHTDNLKRAVEWIRRQMAKREDRSSHPSFAAARFMEEADKKFNLQSFGVEGWATQNGRSGVSYLNFGDPYVPTIVVRTSPYHHSIHLARSGWASFAGH